MKHKEQNEGENPISGFRINSLILLESNFSRVPVLTLNEEIIPNVNIDISVNVNNENVIVKVTVAYSLEHNGIEEVHIKISMGGSFQRIGETQIEDLKRFGEVNGAAIIFPYIREHLTSLSAKAGLGLIILPPMNFTSRRPSDRPAH